ncbi:MAG: hypothetical protein ACM3S1_03230 [Hyphomicrobiales bacterium]
MPTEVVLPSRTYREQAKSLEELLLVSDVCFTAELVRQEADYWPAENPQISVFSRFQVRVRDVFHGDLQPGSESVLMIAGGNVASVGDPSPGGSFRPQPGQSTVAVRYEDQPFPQAGRVEFVCASRFEGWAADIGQVYVPNPDGRFAVYGDRLAPLVPPQDSSPAVRSVLASATLDTVAAAFRTAGARVEAHP